MPRQRQASISRADRGFFRNVADVSTVIRVALTSSRMTPDLYEIMKLLGEDRIRNRINKCIEK